MDLEIKIETEKLALLKRLESLFGSITIESIAELVEGIDIILLEHLGQCLVRHAGDIFNANRIDEEKQNFYIGSIRLELEIATNVQQTDCLIVCLVPRDLNLERSQTRPREGPEVKVDGLGRYSSIIYCVPGLCPIANGDLLSALTREVFIVGYNWMDEKTMKCVREASDDANQSLYKYMQTVVTDRRLLKGFVFSALIDEKDFVILDESVIHTAILLAANNAWKLGRSPADIAVQAMMQVIPRDDSVIVDTVQGNKTVDFDLTVDKYYQSDNSFSEAMRAVWGSSVSCFPIMLEGRMLLIALFPTEFKTQLEPILIVHRSRLEEIAKEKFSCMKNLLQMLMKVLPSNWAETIGKFLGTFSGSFYNSLHHH